MTDYRLPINYLDSGRVSRDKINDSFNEVVQTVIGYRPHIENGIWWIGETNTGVKALGDSISMKVEDGYIRYKSESQLTWTQVIALEDIKGDKGDPGDPGEKGNPGASIVSADFSGDNIIFVKDDSEIVTLANAKNELKGDPGEKGNPGTDAWEYMTQAQYDALPDSKLTDGISRAVWDEAVPHLRTLLREANNILHYNDEDELYADMQFEDGLTPVSTFPIGVSVGNVDNADGWSQDGLLINVLTADGEYVRWLYGDDGKLYFDGGTGTFSQIATTADITSALASLRTELSTVAFTGKSSDLDNDAGFTSDQVMTYEEYEELGPGTATDDVRYFITD